MLLLSQTAEKDRFDVSCAFLVLSSPPRSLLAFLSLSLLGIVSFFFSPHPPLESRGRTEGQWRDSLGHQPRLHAAASDRSRHSGQAAHRAGQRIQCKSGPDEAAGAKPDLADTSGSAGLWRDNRRPDGPEIAPEHARHATAQTRIKAPGLCGGPEAPKTDLKVFDSILVSSLFFPFLLSFYEAAAPSP